MIPPSKSRILSCLLAILCFVSLLVMYTRSQCEMVPVPPLDVYLINLDRARTRLHTFTKRWRACDLGAEGFIRYPAVDGKKINVAEHVSLEALQEILASERTGYRTRHYQLTRGGIGCYLSHVSLWREILNSEKDAAFIFEDDAIMVQNIGEVLGTLEIPQDTDIYLLGYICNTCTNTHCGAIDVKKFYGLHGYIITRRGIHKLLARHEQSLPIRKQIDSWLSDLAREGYINIYASPYQYVVQDATLPTSIQTHFKPEKTIDPFE